MEPEGSLPHSQQPATCPSSVPDQSSPSHFRETHFNIIFQSEPRYSKLSPSLRSPHQTLYAPLVSPIVLRDPPISFFLVLSPE